MKPNDFERTEGQMTIDAFFSTAPYFDARFPVVKRLLAPTTDLRQAYTLLTGEPAPKAWRSPVWHDVDSESLAHVIAIDLLRALSSLGIREDECYERQYRLYSEDFADYDMEVSLYKDYVLNVAREAVALRVAKDAAKRGQKREKLM